MESSVVVSRCGFYKMRVSISFFVNRHVRIKAINHPITYSLYLPPQAMAATGPKADNEDPKVRYVVVGSPAIMADASVSCHGEARAEEPPRRKWGGQAGPHLL